ncbi:MAG: hypothetical protein JEZ00_19310 [Anaerolineaceae bacterium]|nr:hypothetical protein [Anaerolineaceae bacterium]
MKRLITLVILIPMLFGLAGCNLPTVPESMPVVENTVAVILLTDTPEMPTAEMPVEEPMPTETDVPEITHVMQPKYGDGKAQTIHDQVSDKTASEQRAYGGDEFINGRYERPFLAEEMEYIPAIDIVRTDLYRDEDDVWAYATIEVISLADIADDDEISFAIEIDEDLDGRGDALILAAVPQVDQWTTAGVQIWKDINQSIGNSTPMKPDENGGSDGYEVLIFDEGIGDDADLAWVRKSDASENAIEIAFKLNLISKTEEAFLFLWGAWAFAEDPHLDWFDHHDTLTLEEAGSPVKENDEYPLKEFYAADNTCRGLSGMEPTGSLPGMCPYTPPVTTHETNKRCTWENCCPSVVAGCTMHYDWDTCECVPD